MGRNYRENSKLCFALLTSVLQSHHHGLLDEVPLDEAAEVVPVHSEVR